MHNYYEQSEMAQMILNSIGDAVITTNVRGKVEFLNPVAEEMTGWKLEEAIGQHFEEVVYLFDGATHELYPDPVKTCLEAGHKITTADNTLLVSRDGRKLFIKDSAAPVCDSIVTLLVSYSCLQTILRPTN